MLSLCNLSPVIDQDHFSAPDCIRTEFIGPERKTVEESPTLCVIGSRPKLKLLCGDFKHSTGEKIYGLQPIDGVSSQVAIALLQTCLRR